MVGEHKSNLIKALEILEENNIKGWKVTQDTYGVELEFHLNENPIKELL
jgi:hypothetical protein